MALIEMRHCLWPSPKHRKTKLERDTNSVADDDQHNNCDCIITEKFIWMSNIGYCCHIHSSFIFCVITHFHQTFFSILGFFFSLPFQFDSKMVKICIIMHAIPFYVRLCFDCHSSIWSNKKKSNKKHRKPKKKNWIKRWWSQFMNRGIKSKP